MSEQPDRMLVIAPHPDDEVLGAGGTIARFAAAGGSVTVLTVAAHMPPLYSEEVHRRTVAEARRAHTLLGVERSVFLDHPAVLLGEIPLPDFNRDIQSALDEAAPDVLLIPFYDRHVDHRNAFDAAMVAARPVGAGRRLRLVAAYETLSETHWNAPHLEPGFTPSLTVDISSEIERKLEAMRCYESQLTPFPEPRSLEALRALALFRGSQAGVAYAEAFQIVRMTSLRGAGLPL
jgi:LmbE family N-acetylglucosaminyl deacetylase